MKTSIYSRHRFHPDIICRAVWMYFRFNLSFRDVEELMIERGIDVSYETIRRWVDKFGSTYSKRIRSRAETPSPVWHLDEVYTKIDGKMVYLWRAVDDEGTVLGNSVSSLPQRVSYSAKPRKLGHSLGRYKSASLLDD